MAISNFIIKNVTLNYVHIDEPITPFDREEPIFDVQVVVPKSRKKELEPFGKPRAVDGGYAINLKRYTKTLKDNKKVTIECVTGAGKDFRAEYGDAKCIGNGSKGSVIGFQYQKNGRTFSRLSAVQVTDLKKFESKPQVEFDIID